MLGETQVFLLSADADSDGGTAVKKLCHITTALSLLCYVNLQPISNLWAWGKWPVCDPVSSQLLLAATVPCSICRRWTVNLGIVHCLATHHSELLWTTRPLDRMAFYSSLELFCPVLPGEHISSLIQAFFRWHRPFIWSLACIQLMCHMRVVFWQLQRTTCFSVLSNKSTLLWRWHC